MKGAGAFVVAVVLLCLATSAASASCAPSTFQLASPSMTCGSLEASAGFALPANCSDDSLSYASEFAAQTCQDDAACLGFELFCASAFSASAIGINATDNSTEWSISQINVVSAITKTAGLSGGVPCSCLSDTIADDVLLGSDGLFPFTILPPVQPGGMYLKCDNLTATIGASNGGAASLATCPAPAATAGATVAVTRAVPAATPGPTRKLLLHPL